jgi:hypothetical protein
VHTLPLAQAALQFVGANMELSEPEAATGLLTRAGYAAAEPMKTGRAG